MEGYLGANGYESPRIENWEDVSILQCAFSILYLLLEYIHVPDFAVRSSSLRRRLTRRLVYDMKGPRVLGRSFPFSGVPLFA